MTGTRGCAWWILMICSVIKCSTLCVFSIVIVGIIHVCQCTWILEVNHIEHHNIYKPQIQGWEHHSLEATSRHCEESFFHVVLVFYGSRSLNYKFGEWIWGQSWCGYMCWGHDVWNTVPSSMLRSEDECSEAVGHLATSKKIVLLEIPCTIIKMLTKLANLFLHLS